MPAGSELFVFFGLTASGKSTLAEAFAARRGIAYYNSDRLRKELAGLAATAACPDGLDQGLYAPEFTRRTYDALLRKAELELGGGRSLVLDGSYQSAAERQLVRELARRHGARVIFIRCYCPEEETARRLALRAEDPHAVSDGRWEVYQRQVAAARPPAELAASELFAIDTSASVEELLTTLEVELRRNCRV